jgi:ribosome-associated translation inhibitor RaiA
MIIQVNTDKNVEGDVRLESYCSAELEKALFRFQDKITRLEVHLADENSEKAGVNDMRCIIEARPAKMNPIVVTDHGSSKEKAFHGALDKIKKSLTTTFEKQKEF